MCAQGDEGGGCTSFPETPGIRRASGGREPGASCRIIQARFCLPGDFHGPLHITPGIKEAGHMGRAGMGCALCPRAQRPRRGNAKGVAIAKLGSVLLQRVFSGWSASVSRLGQGTRGHCQWETGHRAGRRRKPAPRGALVCGLFLLAPARPLEGCSATLGSQCSLRVFPETLLDFSQFCCFQTPESALWSARASAVLQVEARGGVTGSLSGRLCDGAGLSATVSASWGLWADVHSPVPDLPSQVPPLAPVLCAVPLLTFGDASCFSRACIPLTCFPR